jgi:hypothetical protein
MPAIMTRLLNLAVDLINALFRPAANTLTCLVHVGTIAGLYLAGIWLWGIFFSWGNIAFDFLDWAEVTGPRLAVLRDAAEQGVLPLHAGNTTALRGVTDRYFSIADTPFTPQYLLLPRLGLGQYVFYDTLLFYTIGFLGLILIYRKYRLSPVTFAALWLLFNFNGNVTGHLAVGHSIWTGHFLLPFFVLLVLSLVEKERAGWRWILGLALTLLVILLQGYFHLYLGCLMFLALLALMNFRLLRPVILGGLITVLVSLPRLLPPALVLEGITPEYLGGFASVADMFDWMIRLRDPYQAVQPLTDTVPLNGWELDYYIGLLGFLFVGWFGVVQPLRLRRDKAAPQTQILVACLVMAAFSIGEVFGFIVRVFTVPPLTGERATVRMLILPLVVLMVYAAIHAQQVIERRGLLPWVQIILLGLVGLAYHDINQHLQVWRVRYLDPMVDLFPKVPFDPAQHTIANHADPLYTNLLLAGLVVAMIALGFLVVQSIRQKNLETG